MQTEEAPIIGDRRGATVGRLMPKQSRRRPSEWRIPGNRDPMHASALARIIVESAVLSAAVVPDRHRTDLPTESAGKLGLNGMCHQKIQDRSRLGMLETIKRLRVIA